MAGYDSISRFRQNNNSNRRFTGITTGRVVDTNDPYQIGRVRVFCPALGDISDHKINEIPWASYCSPSAGTSFGRGMGPTQEKSSGATSFGFFSVPPVGTYVFLSCVDGDPSLRFWIGCMAIPNSAASMPHGSYQVVSDENSKLGLTGKIDGPMTASAQPIQPLYNNTVQAFSKNESRIPGTPQTGHGSAAEWMSRALDYSASTVTKDAHSNTGNVSAIPGDVDATVDTGTGTTFNLTQGYAQSRVEYDEGSGATGGKVFESSTFSWTTPGFHAISMDDRPENCRIRLRTTCGHQILMDDTNERIYISPAQGNAWVEIDQNGNIDVYSARRISMRAEGDINFTTESTFRVQAGKGIHMVSGGEFRTYATGDVSVLSGAVLRLQGVSETRITSSAGMHIAAGAELNLTSTTDTNLLASGQTKITSAGTLNLGTADKVRVSGTRIDLNGPPAAVAAAAKPAQPKEAYKTNRAPEHEPWPRVMFEKTDNDGPFAELDKERPPEDPNNVPNEQKAQFEYTSSDIGFKELDEIIYRNPLFKR